jgi:phosphoglycerate dehydrogenase-like enzyme
MREADNYLDQATVFVTYGEDMNEDTIAKAPNLKWIMVLSAGVERLPFQAIEARNILVTNSRGIHKIQMAEYTISMLLQVYRQEKEVIENEKQSIWGKVPVQEITGRTMLVLGTGAIGQEVARLAKAFRMKTIGFSHSGRAVESFDEVYQINHLDQKLPEADFVVSVLPSTNETKYLLQAEHFKQMKNDAVFVNIGRGDVVASDIILRAVQEKEIAHAVLDVFEQEPLPAEHPFWKEPNITVTPHISGKSPEYLPRALSIFQENLHKFLQAEADFVNIVNTARGY